MQTLVPQSIEVGGPVPNHLEWTRVKSMQGFSALPARRHQVPQHEDAHVFDDGGPTHAKLLLDVFEGTLLSLKKRQYPPPGRIGNSLEKRVRLARRFARLELSPSHGQQ